MRRALLLDTETTGTDPAVDRVIEVAACLYDLELGCPIESYASLIRYAFGNPIERINRIPSAALVTARQPELVWRRVLDLAAESDAFAAHNADFDRGFFEAAIPAVYGPAAAANMIAAISGKPWCCTMGDFLWDRSESKKLVEIALSYDLGVASAHRALVDVDTMARVLTRVRELGGDLPEMFRRAARPKKRFVALVSYEMRQVAKDAGFSWDGVRREWWRNMPPEEAAALSFRTVQRD